jgi:hypothetical protein
VPALAYQTKSRRHAPGNLSQLGISRDTHARGTVEIATTNLCRIEPPVALLSYALPARKEGALQRLLNKAVAHEMTCRAAQTGDFSRSTDSGESSGVRDEAASVGPPGLAERGEKSLLTPRERGVGHLVSCAAKSYAR